MDFYNLKKDWETCKLLTETLEREVEKFIKRPTVERRCALIRKKSKDIEKLGKKIKKNIIRQRQDLKSDYS